MTLTVLIVVAILGAILMFSGLIGRLKLKELELGPVHPVVRTIMVVSGSAFVIYAASADSANPKQSFSNMAPIAETAAATSPPVVVTSVVTEAIIVTAVPPPPQVITTTEYVTVTITDRSLRSKSSIPIEQFGVRIYDSSGVETGSGRSSSSLSFYNFDGSDLTYYSLGYTLPTTNSEAVYLVFRFQNQQDLVGYEEIRFRIKFKDEDTRCYLVVEGTSGTKRLLLKAGDKAEDDRIRVTVDDTSDGIYYEYRIPLETVFRSVGLSSVKWLYFMSNSEVNAGKERVKDSITVSGLELVRR